jgi:hypothetical protein
MTADAYFADDSDADCTENSTTDYSCETETSDWVVSPNTKNKNQTLVGTVY